MNSQLEPKIESSSGPNKTAACGCAAPLPPPAADKPGWRKYLPWGVAGLAVWWLVYHSLAPFAAWFTYSLCGLAKGTHLGATVEFFVFESPKVLMLLTLVVLASALCGPFSRRNGRGGFCPASVKPPATCWRRCSAP
jgi:hypothetical protein